VVNKFIEFFGEGLKSLSVADRATISNMSPENGSTCGYFPIDEETLKYMKLSARPKELIELVEKYAKTQGMWRDDSHIMEFSDIIELNLSNIQPCLAGPRRPHDRVVLGSVNDNFASSLASLNKNPDNVNKEFEVKNKNFKLKNGDVIIAAITSCTNTSNPSVMIGAAMLARNAIKHGLNVKPWVKTSLAPGSKVVTEYLQKTGLQEDLNKLGFYLVGYGCTTCIGNSGPLIDEIEETIQQNNLVVVSVLSGNRNFEGRIHPLVRANYLASPMLCVAYAIAGTVNIDLTNDPIGYDNNGKPVLLKEIWPSNQAIRETVDANINEGMFASRYAGVFNGDEEWQKLSLSGSENYNWDGKSTYIKKPPYFDNITGSLEDLKDIRGAKLLAVFGDSITTDHISPAGSIAKDSPAARYLNEHGIKRKDFNSYGSRRGNHEIMMRGTFANIRIKNELVSGIEGGVTKYMTYKAEGIPTIIIAGKEYGSGSSRDWAAKGPKLLGVKAIIAESFERIHRSNLVGMGVFPLVFTNNMSRLDLKLTGSETFNIIGLQNIAPLKGVKCVMKRADSSVHEFDLVCRIDTEVEVDYINAGGILNFMLKKP
jgi:aconitate hydratase